jgi:hypothetical protein
MMVTGGRMPFARAGEMGVGGGKMTQPARLQPSVRAELNAAEKAAPKPDAPFARYAEEYPPVGPPEQRIDPKSGKPYLGKAETPEAAEFMKARAKIVKDMQTRGYTPYYDPAKRFHADPSKYPARTVETLQELPAKPETLAKHLENIGAPETRQRLQEAYRKGTKLGDSKDWYAMGQLEADFIKTLGAKKGREAFLDRFGTSMAATTGGADPTSNLLMSSYGNYLRAHYMPYPKAAYEMPSPIGGRYVTGNMTMHHKMLSEGGYAGIGASNPKRHNFARNFIGDLNAATIDEQMTAGMVPGMTKPPPGQYGIYERVLGEEAKKLGIKPANFQDVAWIGFKGTQGKSMISHVNDAIERTHRLTGMPRKEIVERALIKGEIPLYGLGGMIMLEAARETTGDRQ